jgi:hypothetical protein
LSALFDHRLWHVLVLAGALLGTAGLVILLLGPLMPQPAGKPALPRWLWAALAILGITLALAEWWLVH